MILPVIQDQDLVRPHNRRKPMRDHDGRPMRHQIIERFLNQPLGRRVHARGRLIQNQNRRILQAAPAQSRDAVFHRRSISRRVHRPRFRDPSAIAR